MENVANTGKQKNTKVMIAVVAVVLVAVVALVFVLMNKEEAYRSIQVYKVEGNVEVDRPQIGVLEAYANMMLQTLDIVNVSDNSNLQVKLDEDKYILLEPNTKIRLEAAGNSQDSKTKIYVEQGAIVCNIENKLSANSTYEVNTPNSTMAVRGTTFRVEVTFDEEGNSYTVAAVYEGVVESHLVYPNGELSAEGVNITAGSQAEIKGTADDVEYIFTGEDITYEELEQVTLDFLDVLLDKGTELSISKEELTSLISNLSKQNDKSTTGDSVKTEETQMSEQTQSKTPENAQVDANGSTTNDDTSATAGANELGNTEANSNKNTSGDKGVVENQGGTNNKDTSDSTGTSNNENGSNSEDLSGDTDSSDGEASNEDNEDVNKPNKGDTSDNEGASDEEDVSGDDEKNEPSQYTVTFTYKGKVFAIQMVKAGECATTPRLLPTPIGYWDYDFSQPVTADVTMTWIDTTGQQ